MDNPAPNNIDLPLGARLPEHRSLGASLLFQPGSRPSADDIRRLFASAEMAGTSARISHCPGPAEGWLEILASGLTFDLRGLAPAQPARSCPAPHRYGFTGGAPDAPLEAIEIVPGGNVAGGGRALPVVRTLAGIAANLALNLPAAAVVWHTAGTFLEPRYFARTVFDWLSGGAFPALGLTALFPASDGSIASDGLAHFIGQEMQLAGAPDEARAQTIKHAVRVVDYLVRNGTLTQAREISGAGVTLLVEPSRHSNRVWVWRK